MGTSGRSCLVGWCNVGTRGRGTSTGSVRHRISGDAFEGRRAEVIAASCAGVSF